MNENYLNIIKHIELQKEHAYDSVNDTDIIKGSIGIISQINSVSTVIGKWFERDTISSSGIIDYSMIDDIDESDCLNYYNEDDSTKVIGLYFIGPNNGDKFKKTISAISMNKPIILMKPAERFGDAKTKSYSEHSVIGNDQIFYHACKQFGVVQTDSLTEYYDSLRLFASSMMPKGNRLFVLISSLDMTFLLEDEIRKCNLEAVTYNELSAIDEYVAKSIEESFDIFFLMVVDPVDCLEKKIEMLKEKTDKPVVVVYMGDSETRKRRIAKLNELGVQVFSTPDRALIALSNLSWYSKWKENHS